MNTPFLPRDERGWRIPTPHTRCWEIYHLMVDGWKAREIVALMGEEMYKTSIRVQMTRIRNPEVNNANSNKTAAKYRSRRSSKKFADGDSAYVRKLVNILGWSVHKARDKEAELKHRS